MSGENQEHAQGGNDATEKGQEMVHTTGKRVFNLKGQITGRTVIGYYGSKREGSGEDIVK